MNRGTLTQLFFTTVDRHAGLPAAFRSKVGGAWVSVAEDTSLPRYAGASMSAGANLDGATASYRVCTVNRANNVAGEECADPQLVTHATHNSCSYSSGGSSSGGGSSCKGHCTHHIE